jgi:hypothetical protein
MSALKQAGPSGETRALEDIIDSDFTSEQFDDLNRRLKNEPGGDLEEIDIREIESNVDYDKKESLKKPEYLETLKSEIISAKGMFVAGAAADAGPPPGTMSFLLPVSSQIQKEPIAKQNMYQALDYVYKLKMKAKLAKYDTSLNGSVNITKNLTLIVGSVVILYCSVQFGGPAMLQFLFSNGFIYNKYIQSVAIGALEKVFLFLPADYGVFQNYFIQLANFDKEKFIEVMGMLKGNFLLMNDIEYTEIEGVLAADKKLILKHIKEFRDLLSKFFITKKTKDELSSKVTKIIDSIVGDNYSEALMATPELLKEFSSLLFKLNFVFNGGKMIMDLYNPADATNLYRLITKNIFTTLINPQSRFLATTVINEIRPIVESILQNGETYFYISLGDGNSFFSRANLSTQIASVLFTGAQKIQTSSVDFLLDRTIGKEVPLPKAQDADNPDDENSPKNKRRRELLAEKKSAQEIKDILEREYGVYDNKPPAIDAAFLDKMSYELKKFYNSVKTSPKIKTINGKLFATATGYTFMMALLSDVLVNPLTLNPTTVLGKLRFYLFPIYNVIKSYLEIQVLKPGITTITEIILVPFQNLIRGFYKSITYLFSRNNILNMLKKVNGNIYELRKNIIVRWALDALDLFWQFFDTIGSLIFDIVAETYLSMAGGEVRSMAVTYSQFLDGLTLDSFFHNLNIFNRFVHRKNIVNTQNIVEFIGMVISNTKYNKINMPYEIIYSEQTKDCYEKFNSKLDIDFLNIHWDLDKYIKGGVAALSLGLQFYLKFFSVQNTEASCLKVKEIRKSYGDQLVQRTTDTAAEIEEMKLRRREFAIQILFAAKLRGEPLHTFFTQDIFNKMDITNITTFQELQTEFTHLQSPPIYINTFIDELHQKYKNIFVTILKSRPENESKTDEEIKLEYKLDDITTSLVHTNPLFQFTSEETSVFQQLNQDITRSISRELGNIFLAEEQKKRKDFKSKFIYRHGQKQYILTFDDTIDGTNINLEDPSHKEIFGSVGGSINSLKQLGYTAKFVDLSTLNSLKRNTLLSGVTDIGNSEYEIYKNFIETMKKENIIYLYRGSEFAELDAADVGTYASVLKTYNDLGGNVILYNKQEKREESTDQELESAFRVLNSSLTHDDKENLEEFIKTKDRVKQRLVLFGKALERSKQAIQILEENQYLDKKTTIPNLLVMINYNNFFSIFPYYHIDNYVIDENTPIGDRTIKRVQKLLQQLIHNNSYSSIKEFKFIFYSLLIGDQDNTYLPLLQNINKEVWNIWNSTRKTGQGPLDSEKIFNENQQKTLRKELQDYIYSSYFSDIPNISIFKSSDKTIQEIIDKKLKNEEKYRRDSFFTNYFVDLKTIIGELRAKKDKYKENSDTKWIIELLEGEKASENFQELTETLTDRSIHYANFLFNYFQTVSEDTKGGIKYDSKFIPWPKEYFGKYDNTNLKNFIKHGLIWDEKNKRGLENVEPFFPGLSNKLKEVKEGIKLDIGEEAYNKFMNSGPTHWDSSEGVKFNTVIHKYSNILQDFFKTLYERKKEDIKEKYDVFLENSERFRILQEVFSEWKKNPSEHINIEEKWIEKLPEGKKTLSTDEKDKIAKKYQEYIDLHTSKLKELKDFLEKEIQLNNPSYQFTPLISGSEYGAPTSDGQPKGPGSSGAAGPGEAQKESGSKQREGIGQRQEQSQAQSQLTAEQVGQLQGMVPPMVAESLGMANALANALTQSLANMFSSLANMFGGDGTGLGRKVGESALDKAGEAGLGQIGKTEATKEPHKARPNAAELCRKYSHVYEIKGKDSIQLLPEFNNIPKEDNITEDFLNSCPEVSHFTKYMKIVSHTALDIITRIKSGIIAVITPVFPKAATFINLALNGLFQQITNEIETFFEATFKKMKQDLRTNLGNSANINQPLTGPLNIELYFSKKDIDLADKKDNIIILIFFVIYSIITDGYINNINLSHAIYGIEKKELNIFGRYKQTETTASLQQVVFVSLAQKIYPLLDSLKNKSWTDYLYPSTYKDIVKEIIKTLLDGTIVGTDILEGGTNIILGDNTSNKNGVNPLRVFHTLRKSIEGEDILEEVSQKVTDRLFAVIDKIVGFFKNIMNGGYCEMIKFYPGELKDVKIRIKKGKTEFEITKSIPFTQIEHIYDMYIKGSNIESNRFNLLIGGTPVKEMNKFNTLTDEDTQTLCMTDKKEITFEAIEDTEEPISAPHVQAPPQPKITKEMIFTIKDIQDTQTKLNEVFDLNDQREMFSSSGIYIPVLSNYTDSTYTPFDKDKTHIKVFEVNPVQNDQVSNTDPVNESYLVFIRQHGMSKELREALKNAEIPLSENHLPPVLDFSFVSKNILNKQTDPTFQTFLESLYHVVELSGKKVYYLKEDKKIADYLGIDLDKLFRNKILWHYRTSDQEHNMTAQPYSDNIPEFKKNVLLLNIIFSASQKSPVNIQKDEAGNITGMSLNVRYTNKDHPNSLGLENIITQNIFIGRSTTIFENFITAFWDFWGRLSSSSKKEEL